MYGKISSVACGLMSILDIIQLSFSKFCSTVKLLLAFKQDVSGTKD